LSRRSVLSEFPTRENRQQGESSVHCYDALVKASILVIALVSGATWGRAAEYDPLAPRAKPTQLDLVVRDQERQRDIPLRVYRPAAAGKAPVVLFSHGLGGSWLNSPYLGQHWGARGYVVVHLQHAGSDEDVWRDLAAAERLAALQREASVENSILEQRDRWQVK
jgi:predicted dienelactone hydrolase